VCSSDLISGLHQLIGESDKALKNLDEKIWMESDKELQTVETQK
jgi:hypothetical protein